MAAGRWRPAAILLKSNGHISATGINFMFGSSVGFSGLGVEWPISGWAKYNRSTGESNALGRRYLNLKYFLYKLRSQSNMRQNLVAIDPVSDQARRLGAENKEINFIGVL